MQHLLVLICIVIFYLNNGLFAYVLSDAEQILETRDGRDSTKILHFKGDSLMEDVLTADDVRDLYAVQIIETRDGRNGTKVLHYKGGSVMEDVLTADGIRDLPILVYSVTGKTRGGKSFLLNLMYKYLDAMGASNWTEGPVPKVFDFKDGVDSLTKGLWLCKRIFRQRNKDGTEVGIMLMDNQGLFDGEVTGGESVAMSGVSTILSHVQMFNMKEKITTNDLEQIMLHLVPQIDVDQDGDHSTTGSSLMFVVRDFIGGKTYGYGLTNGSKYIANEQKRGTKEYQSMWADQRSVFNQIDCVMLPYPGTAVMSEEFTVAPTLQVLEGKFVSTVTTFIQELFSPTKLIPRPGVLTGQKMQDTLTKLDGKVADGSMSYYNMFVDRANNLILQESMKNFTNRVNTSRDIYKAKDIMDDILSTTRFKGQFADTFVSTLKTELTGIINGKVTKHLVDMYNTALRAGGILSSHRNIWAKVLSDFRLLQGSKSDVGKIKENVVKDMATVFYIKLDEEETAKFQRFCETADSKQFYEKMLALNTSGSINLFARSTIKPCNDFTSTGASAIMLQDILDNEQNRFEASVHKCLLRNMYKVKESVVQNYKNQLHNRPVKYENANIWPKYKQIIRSLQFDMESEKIETTRAIYKDIGVIYYGLLREEVFNNLKSDWNKLSDDSFLAKYEAYKDESRLKAMLVGIFPKYDEFNFTGHSEIWERESDVLKTNVQLLLYRGLKSKGYEKEAATFWEKLLEALNAVGAALKEHLFGSQG